MHQSWLYAQSPDDFYKTKVIWLSDAYCFLICNMINFIVIVETNWLLQSVKQSHPEYSDV